MASRTSLATMDGIHDIPGQRTFLEHLRHPKQSSFPPSDKETDVACIQENAQIERPGTIVRIAQQSECLAQQRFIVAQRIAGDLETLEVVGRRARGP